MVVGQAVWSLCGVDRWVWTSPAVGFACLLVVCDAVVRLPGGGLTSSIALVIVFVAAAARIARRVELREPVLLALPVVVVVGLIASGSFLVNESFGIPAVSILDDFANHLPWAEALRTHTSPFSLIIRGYPLGPFALAGTLGELPGVGVLAGFQGLLIATPVLIALSSLALFGQLSLIPRLFGAALVGLAYLAVAALAEGAFKEPVEALFGVGIALTLQQLAAPGSDRGRWAAVPIAVLTAGSVANYSYPGLAWPGLITAFWLVAETVRHRHLLTRDFLRRAAVVIAIGLAVLVVLALPEIVRFRDFQRAQVSTLNLQVGNFGALNHLPFTEALGVWFSPDFRFKPDQATAVRQLLTAFAFLVFAFGVLRACLRRDTGILAFLLAAIAVAVYGRAAGNSYYSAKPMMVLSTAVVLISVRGLLSAGDTDAEAAAPDLRGRRRPTLASAAWLPWPIGAIIAAAFGAACLWSDGLVFRGSFVGPAAHAHQLAQLRPTLRRHRVLFLGTDNFAVWELRDRRLSYVSQYAPISQLPQYRPDKPHAPGRPVDFDSVDPRWLDRFDYVVTPRTAFASVPPLNWSRAAATSSYEVWRRAGATPPHAILTEDGAPGAVLDCSTPTGRSLSHAAGAALVRPPPVVGDRRAWRGTGTKLFQQLYLPAGRWQLSLQYISASALTVKASSLQAVLPADLEPAGPYWFVGEVTSTGGRIAVSVRAHPLPGLATRRIPAIGNIALVKVDTPARSVPLRTACGQYVDWYQRSTVRVFPADGATGVSSSTRAYAAFAEPMDHASTQHAFSLARSSDHGSIGGRLVWFGDALVFEPARPLAPRTRYTATVATAKDQSGHTLAYPTTWQFTTQ
jgi:hypothetical protein